MADVKRENVSLAIPIELTQAGGYEMAIDPKQVFKTAEVFRASSVILGNLINQGMPQYMFPWVVCSSFSLELYLKCLILVEGGSSKGHDLEQLFSKIAPESQKRIRASYETHKTKTDAMFASFKGLPTPKTDFDLSSTRAQRPLSTFVTPSKASSRIRRAGWPARYANA